MPILVAPSADPVKLAPGGSDDAAMCAFKAERVTLPPFALPDWGPVPEKPYRRVEMPGPPPDKADEGDWDEEEDDDDFDGGGFEPHDRSYPAGYLAGYPRAAYPAGSGRDYPAGYRPGYGQPQDYYRQHEYRQHPAHGHGHAQEHYDQWGPQAVRPVTYAAPRPLQPPPLRKNQSNKWRSLILPVLSLRVAVGDIRKLFQEYGIKSVKVVRGRRTAFVNFGTHEDAACALYQAHLGELVLVGQVVQAGWAKRNADATRCRPARRAPVVPGGYDDAAMCIEAERVALPYHGGEICR